MYKQKERELVTCIYRHIAEFVSRANKQGLLIHYQIQQPDFMDRRLCDDDVQITIKLGNVSYKHYISQYHILAYGTDLRWLDSMLLSMVGDCARKLCSS